jgi:hypothetical protein
LPFLDEFANKDKLFVMENQYNMLNNLDWGEIYGEHIYKSAYTFWPIVALYKDAGDKYQGGLKLQAWTLAVLPHSLVGQSMTYGVPKILKRIRHLK